MRLTINKNQIEGNVDRFIRRAGYSYFSDRRSGKESYSRRLGRGIFPKLHMYIKEQGEKIVFDLHLDQKQASYSGQKMHSGEYDGPVVEGEIERLSGLVRGDEVLNPPRPKGHPSKEGNFGMSGRIGHGELPVDGEKVEKKGWLGRLFG